MNNSYPKQRRYVVRVRGFDGVAIDAPSAGQAKYKAFRSYIDAGYGRAWPGTITFKEWLTDRLETVLHMGAVQ